MFRSMYDLYITFNVPEENNLNAAHPRFPPPERDCDLIRISTLEQINLNFLDIAKPRLACWLISYRKTFHFQS